MRHSTPTTPTPFVRDAIPGDFQAILALQRANHRDSLTDAEKATQGFVSLISTPDDLSRALKEAAVVVAIDGKRIVGYEYAYSVEHARQNPYLEYEVGLYPKIPFEGKSVSDYRPCMLAQILVDKPYRGTGLATKMHEFFLSRLHGTYGILVSGVSPQNTRSIAFHHRIGMKTIHAYEYKGHEWLIPVQRIP